MLQQAQQGAHANGVPFNMIANLNATQQRLLAAARQGSPGAPMPQGMFRPQDLAPAQAAAMAHFHQQQQQHQQGMAYAQQV